MGFAYFGQFLIDKGYISSEQLVQALDDEDAQRAVAMALRKGMLLRQELKSLQERFGAHRFAVILKKAVKERSLAQSQVERLMRLQRSDWRHLAARLVEQSVLSQERIDQAIEEYKEAQQAYGLKAKALPAHFRGRADMVVLINMTESIFRGSAAAEISFGHPQAFQGDPRRWPFIVEVGFTGEYQGRYIIGLSVGIADAVAGPMIGPTGDQASADELHDAVGELCNYVAGAASATLAGLGQDFKFAPPRLLQPDHNCPLIHDGIFCALQGGNAGDGGLIIE